ncbi:hypothetical protein COUCH_25080 [Couchioplanes caeruleus]|uniref:hypothetical protein n=1 Tax=Couchioplanes caeruleus TaxID=56438 RepID=UPI0020C08CCD|nr:hypothetical protein [Couchioplanes caeruleus]UQU62299.1 hypothetical protein COUCH_25080 [Couchioplanes caeruleus]
MPISSGAQPRMEYRVPNVAGRRRHPRLSDPLRRRLSVPPNLLGALGEHVTATRYEVRFGESAEETARGIREAGDTRVLVLWSFYSPNAGALAEELTLIRSLADGSNRLACRGRRARHGRAGADAGRVLGHGCDR